LTKIKAAVLKVPSTASGLAYCAAQHGGLPFRCWVASNGAHVASAEVATEFGWRPAPGFALICINRGIKMP